VYDLWLPKLYAEVNERVLASIKRMKMYVIGMDGWKKHAAGSGTPLVNIMLLDPNSGSVFWKVVNAAGQVKDHEWIVQLAQRVGEEVNEAKAAAWKGSIMDNTSTNKKAKPQTSLTKLNNGLHIGCGSHGFALLIKDLFKGLAWVKKCYDEAVDMSNAVSNSERIAAMLKTSMLAQNPPNAYSIGKHMETWFGSRNLVLNSCTRVQPSLDAFDWQSAVAQALQRQQQLRIRNQLAQHCRIHCHR
jgi:hypothetical protein